MPEYLHPGVFVEEVSIQRSHVISTVATSVVGFVGETTHIQRAGFDNNALINVPTKLTSWHDYTHQFGLYHKSQSPYLALSVKAFFGNGGKECFIVRVPEQKDDVVFSITAGDVKAALAALEAVDVNLICVPGVTEIAAQQAMIAHCEKCRYRFCILDSPKTADINVLKNHRRQLDSAYGAIYHPWLKVPADAGESVVVPPSGFIAGIYARVDTDRGVHKAPANVGIAGQADLLVNITTAQQDVLNPLHINCLRKFPRKGVLVWGARTLSTDLEWKYINIRRLIIHLEASIDCGTEWVVFESNNERLWSSIKSLVEGFLYDFWRKGALMGSSAKEAYFVRCDRSTITQDDIDNGRVYVIIGIAPLKPAEFIIFKIMKNLQR